MSVVIVGPGMIGAAHAAAWRATGTEVSYLVSRRADASLEHAPNARTVTDLGTALADPVVDIVTICTPTPTHRDLALAALAAGKHVLLEKPMAHTVDDARAIAFAAERSGRVLMVAHVVRFFDGYVRVREAVESGAIGHPVHVRAERMIAPPDTPWWYDDEQSGGLGVDVGIHDLDQSNLLLGDPVRVRATAADALGPVETTVKYADGGLAQVLSHARMPRETSFATSIQVLGDGGLVAQRQVAGSAPVQSFTLRGALADGGVIAVDDDAPDAHDPYTTQAAHFLECVASGRQSRIAPTDAAITALRTALAARDSVRAGGQWVTLRP